MTGDFLSFTASLDRGDRPRVDYQQIATFPIEVPPLPEQHRIVEKIEALFARSTRVRDELAHIPRLIERYRQAVLEAAFRGDLTAEWRKRHADIEPAADFAEKLRQAVVPGRRPVSEIYSHPEFVRTDIPNTWVWCDLGELFDLQRGRFSIRPRNDPTCFGGQMPFVQIGDLPRDGGEIGAYKQTLNEKGVSVSKVFQKGTPLIAIVGATIANTGRLGFDACCPDSLIAMVSCDGAADEYIEQYLQHAKQYIRNLSFASGGQPNINIGTLQKLPVPLPPIGEIHEILRMIEGCRSAIESVSRELVGAVRMTDRLDQSILDKAFAGKLVPQDPADEPASALLARIKAARAEAPASRRGRKAKG